MGDAADRERAEMDELAAEIDQVGRSTARTVELGRRGFVIAVAVFVLLVAQLLPWVGGHAGWQVLAGQGGAIPRLFAATSTGFSVLASALALATRRWWLTWVCAVGGWFATVDGLLAIWSQQSSHSNGTVGGGPGAGMILALVMTIVLASQWMRTAWSRA
jgi:hypothetical protein